MKHSMQKFAVRVVLAFLIGLVTWAVAMLITVAFRIAVDWVLGNELPSVTDLLAVYWNVPLAVTWIGVVTALVLIVDREGSSGARERHVRITSAEQERSRGR